MKSQSTRSGAFCSAGQLQDTHNHPCSSCPESRVTLLQPSFLPLPLVPWNVRPEEWGRGPETLDLWGPRKCRILPGWILDSKAVSFSYGIRPLGSSSSFQQFHVPSWTRGHLCLSLTCELAQALSLCPRAALLFEVFIYLFHGSWEHSV